MAESVCRFTFSSVAGGKSHAPLAPCIPSPYHLPACLPPPSAVLMNKGGQWSLYCPFPCSQEQRSTRCLNRSAPSLSCSRSISLPSISLPLSTISLSLHPVSRLSACHGKTHLCGFFCTCVTDQKREDEGGGEGWCLCLVFGSRLPTVFLLLLPSFILPFSSFYLKGDSLIRRYGTAIPSSLSN